MVEEELFYRAGGLGAVCPIFETSTMLHEGAAKSSRIERMSGYAKLVAERFDVGSGDCFLAVSTSGINPFAIEMAQIAGARGAGVIGITSLCYRKKPSRHRDGLHLPDVCDVCIDSHVPAGDACVTVCTDGTKAGPVWHRWRLRMPLCCRLVRNCVSRGWNPKYSEAGTAPEEMNTIGV
jgi:uncharacterized phosphosugar-binding protein